MRNIIILLLESTNFLGVAWLVLSFIQKKKDYIKLHWIRLEFLILQESSATCLQS